jgi:flagellin
VSALRGTLGATVEQLQAASTVDTNESQNLVTASSNITSADISSVVADDTKYSILEQTGISALQQANQQAQTVLKLLQ